MMQGTRKWFICCWIIGRCWSAWGVLHASAFAGHEKLAQILLDNEADVKAIWNSETALYQR